MTRYFGGAVVLLAFVSLVAAKDEVTVRSQEKPIVGKIGGESIKGVQLDGKGLIPADDIIDVFYDLPSDIKFTVYNGARTAEKDSADPAKDAKRKDNLESAIKKYQEVYAKAPDKGAKRHMKYKVAVLKVRLAQEAGGSTDEALAALKEFKDTYPASWQILPVLQTMAQLYAGGGKFKEAADLYDEMSGFDLSPDAQLDAQIQAASLSIRAKAPEAALKKLEALAPKLAKGSKQAQRLQIAIAECHAAQGKSDDAIGMLRGIVNATTDKSIKAAGYNALGESLMKKEMYKEARWEFLWVDVVYNQDRTEHARALYNLATTFDALGERDRALQCREMLASDREFSGLEYQKLAQRELGGEKKKTK